MENSGDVWAPSPYLISEIKENIHGKPECFPFTMSTDISDKSWCFLELV